MGRFEIAGPVLGCKFSSDLPKNSDRGTHPGHRSSTVPRVCKQTGDPIAKPPNEFSSTASLGKAQSNVQRRKSVTKQLWIETRDFRQHKGGSQLDRAQLPGSSILQQAAQLFHVQPLIPCPCEEELHFDLDPW